MFAVLTMKAVLFAAALTFRLKDFGGTGECCVYLYSSLQST